MAISNDQRPFSRSKQIINGYTEKKVTKHLGKQPPRYRFFFNPYRNMRCTRCPQCNSKMHQRKLPLVIHIDPRLLFSLNKTCRYCPHCDLLIAHQNDVEGLLTAYFTEHLPEMVGNKYLVVGTMERAIWKHGMQQPMMEEETLEALHDFKEVVEFTLVGGWAVDESKLPTQT